MVIFNFRADRVVEMSKALEYKDFDNFDRKRWPDVSPACLLFACLPHMHIIPYAQPQHSQRSLPVRTSSMSQRVAMATLCGLHASCMQAKEEHAKSCVRRSCRSSLPA